MDGQVRMTRRLCTEASETSIETEGGPQVWAREIRQACPEKESPRKGNLLGISFPGEKAHCEQRRCLSSAL